MGYPDNRKFMLYVFVDLKSYEINTPSKTPTKRQQTVSDSRTPPSSPVKGLALIRSPYKTPLTSFRSPCKISSPQKTPNKSSNGNDRLKPMSGARLVCRAEIFKKNLLVLLNDEHNVKNEQFMRMYI